MTQDLSLPAAQDIAAGQEIFISYGDLSDLELLQTYGFVEPEQHPSAGAIVRASDVRKGLRRVEGIDDATVDEQLARFQAALAPCGVFELPLRRLQSSEPHGEGIESPFPTALMVMLQVGQRVRALSKGGCTCAKWDSVGDT